MKTEPVAANFINIWSRVPHLQREGGDSSWEGSGKIPVGISHCINNASKPWKTDLDKDRRYAKVNIFDIL